MVYQITILSMQLLVSKRKKEEPILKEVHDYKNTDRSKLEVDFDTAPWDICNVFDDEEDSVWALVTKCDDHLEEYRKARNETTEMCRITELNYWKGRLGNSFNSKEFWGAVNEMQGKRKC